MKFVSKGPEDAAAAVAAKIIDSVRQKKPTLWLVCGGSNITTEVEIMKQVAAGAPDNLGSLLVLPMDERYGPAGHKDSNAEQMRKAGFDPGAATWVDVLIHNVPLDQTVSFYSDVASVALSKAAFIVGVFGLGANGHTAGVQPNSPAAEADEATVAGFEWSDFTRLTLTPMALKHTNVAYVLTYGASKKEALERLQKNAEPLKQLPSALLYEIPEVYVYNDQIESGGNE